jgi:O-phosphoseryl-tRNA synthetase
MPFDIEKIIRESKVDYEKAWLDTRKLLKIEGNYYNLEKKQKSHIINDFIFEARENMLSLGFEELILPMFIEDYEIYKQYGPEAVLILDRVFYLAGLPRPDIGISNEKINQINKLIPKFAKIDDLKNIFRAYKKGDIEADDLIETFVKNLDIEEETASLIIDKVFPELKELKPIPSNLTLRSHTTALWFKVLAELVKKKKLPLQYFSICPKFRREQKLDKTHLYCSNTLSLVILAEEISLEDCKKISTLLCEKLGFQISKTKIKRATSKYYAPQTEFEIFVEHPKTLEWIEIGDGGFYSPVSLANYNIKFPVFNIGFGIERICMIKSQLDDIRKLVYPYFYEGLSFSDEEISKAINYKNYPYTKKGIEIKDAIIKCAIENQESKSPIEIKVWEGIIKDKSVEVYLWERDEGVNLLGPAALNIVCVKEGNVIGLPTDGNKEVYIKTNKSYIEGIASEFAFQVENLLDQNKMFYELRIKMVYRASEINLKIDDVIMEYIHSNHKKIDIRGPVFVGLSFKVINKD